MIRFLKGGIIIDYKSFQKPLYPLKLFYAKVPMNHPQKSYIFSQMNNIQAGLRGEQSVFHFMEEFTFPEDSAIIHNYQANIHPKWSIQIDFLIISKKGILIMEVKNIAGAIKFQTNPPQLIRTLDGIEVGMDCPFIQLDRNVSGIRKLLTTHPSIPIHSCLVWANRKARLQIEKIPHPHNFLFSKSVGLYLESYFHQPDCLSQEDFQSLKSKLLIQMQNGPVKSLCEQYQVNMVDVVKGLHCTSCFQQLRKHARTWSCPHCKLIAKDDVERNVLSLLQINPFASSISLLQEYLPELSKKQIRSILEKKQVEVTGTKRGVLYNRVRDEQISFP